MKFFTKTLLNRISCSILIGSVSFIASNAANATSSANTSDANVQKVTIAGFGGNDIFAMNKLIKDVLADDFKQQGIEVNYFAVESDYPKYILNSLSSGNAPDAFYVNADVALPWIKTDKLAAFPDWLLNERSDIHPVLASIYQYQGNQYGMPKDLNALALQYNLDVFDDANVDYPSDDDTWDSFHAKLSQVVKNIGDEGVTGLCLSADFNRFAPFAFSTGWRPFDENYNTVLDERFERAFRFYVGLVKDGLAVLPADLGQSWGGGCFAVERAAVTIEGSWVSAYLRDKSPNLQYRSVQLPKDPVTLEQGNLLFTAGWAINKDSKQREATEKVVSMLTSPKAQQAVLESGLAIPSTLGLADSPYFKVPEAKNQLALTIFKATQVEHVVPFAFGPYGNGWMEPIQIALSSAMLGQLSIDEALKEAQARYDEMRKGLKL